MQEFAPLHITPIVAFIATPTQVAVEYCTTVAKAEHLIARATQIIESSCIIDDVMPTKVWEFLSDSFRQIDPDGMDERLWAW